MASFYRIWVFTEKYFRTDYCLNLTILKIRYSINNVIVIPKSLRGLIISYWSVGCQCAIQWWCISEPDSKCKSIAVFAVTWNRYFYIRCESQLESHIVHILVISGFLRRKYCSCFSMLLFGLYLLWLIVKLSTMTLRV